VRATTGLTSEFSLNLSIVVRIQMLGELEEIIQYKRCNDNPKAQEFIRNTWVSR
jgi:FKBP12-rapamycin complex-associated protein